MDGLPPLDVPCNRAHQFPHIDEQILLGNRWPGPVIFASIELRLDGSFVAVPDGGEPAYTVCAYSGGPNSKILDVIAVTESGEVYPMRGASWALGLHNYDRADLMREPLELIANPLDWVAGGGQGACVIDWFVAPPKLASLQEIYCDSEDLAAKVAECLRKYSAPWPKLFARRAS